MPLLNWREVALGWNAEDDEGGTYVIITVGPPGRVPVLSYVDADCNETTVPWRSTIHSLSNAKASCQAHANTWGRAGT